MIFTAPPDRGHNFQIPSHGMLKNTWCGDVPTTNPTPQSQRRASFLIARLYYIFSLRSGKDHHSHFSSDVVKTLKIDRIIRCHYI